MDKKRKSNVVFFTGAGISKESGLKTFRDCEDGMWHNYKIEDVATTEAWENNPEELLGFYNKRRKEVEKAEPNLAHEKIAELESGGRFNVRVITQNVDNLHERAGSSDVIHLHGEIMKLQVEGEVVDAREDLTPHYRPNVVLFGEDILDYEEAVRVTKEADYFIIVGTSMEVYPACNLVYETKDECKIYNINPKVDRRYKFCESIEEVATKGVSELIDIL